jgi:hypothetical protein
MKTKRMPGAQAPARGRELQAYRNGRRAGTHGRGNRPNRSNTRRLAIRADAQS